MKDKKTVEPKTKKTVEPKYLQVKKFGDSLYIPLTKFFRAINIDENEIARVTLVGDEKIEIRRPSKEEK